MYSFSLEIHVQRYSEWMLSSPASHGHTKKQKVVDTKNSKGNKKHSPEASTCQSIKASRQEGHKRAIIELSFNHSSYQERTSKIEPTLLQLPLGTTISIVSQIHKFHESYNFDWKILLRE